MERPTALIILTDSPYGSDRVHAGLRMATALAETGPVRIFLLTDAVAAVIDGQSSPSEDLNIGLRLRALIAKGAQVKVCGLCLESRGIHNAPLVDGVQVGSMPELAAWIRESDRVISL